MSAIAKPLIHPTTADAPANGNLAVVNVDNIQAVSKDDIPPYGDNTAAVYKILFKVLSSDNQVNTVEWKYSSASALVDRDAAYTAIIALASAAI